MADLTSTIAAVNRMLQFVGGSYVESARCISLEDAQTLELSGFNGTEAPSFGLTVNQLGMGMAALDPLLVWGLVVRGIGLVQFIAIGAMIPQVLPWAGRKGVSPVRDLLNRMGADIKSPWARFLNAPTLLWINSSDMMLLFLACLGAGSGLWIAIGAGSLSPLLFFMAWVCFLSLDAPMGLAFPWDCLLMEVSFLAMFFPALDAGAWGTVALPHPLVSFLARFLVWRLMIGFGKLKFIGTTARDKLYIKQVRLF